MKPAAKAHADYFTLEEALALLEVRPQTLYAYVSRGLVQRIAAPDGRSSLYLRSDVEAAKQRSAARARGTRARARRPDMGEPALLTGITEITSRGPRYRNRHALSFAREGCRFEAVAEYLWDGHWDEGMQAWWEQPHHEDAITLLRSGARMRPDIHILEIFKLATLALGMSEGSRKERLMRGEGPASAARRIIRVMAGCFGFIAPVGDYVPLARGEAVSAGLLRIFGGTGLHEDAELALDRALVLAADHELNASTFAARVAASTSADLHSCVGAALSVHYGPLLGRSCDSTAALLAPGISRRALAGKLARYVDSESAPPGFNHALYPEGDPRAAYLLELAAQAAPAGSEVQSELATVGELARELGLKPKIDLGTVMLVRALGLPDAAAAGLFAMGRTAGWVAHVLEQRLAGFMIRPRALYYPAGKA